MLESDATTVVALQELLAHAQHDGPIWSLNSEQFNINVLRFRAGEGVSAHVNNEVDVLGIVIEGAGELIVGETKYALAQGQLFMIPRGARRAIRSTSAVFAYLSCHRRRAALLPS